MRKFLLWDHDGVLVDTERCYFAATRDCLKMVGVQLEQETYLRFMALGRSCWDLAFAQGVPEVAVRHARLDRDRRYQELLATESIEIEGVLEVIAELSSEYRMAIVSTSKRADFNLIHQSRNIRRYFEFVINIEDCKAAKPDPDPYMIALQRFGTRPSAAVAIEDSSRGLAAAISAGIPCAIIKNNFTAEQDFAGAWRVLDSIRQLPKALTDFIY